MRLDTSLVVLLASFGCGDNTKEAHDASLPGDDATPILVAPSPIIVGATQVPNANGDGQTSTSFVVLNSYEPQGGPHRTEKIGSCYINDCLHPLFGGGTGIPAGMITVSNGTTPLMQSPKPDGYYAPAQLVQATPAWTAGDTISIGATGSELAAFSTSLALAPRLTITNPPTALVHTQPLTLTWTGGEGTVLVVLVQLGGTTEDFDDMRVICSFDGASGSGTVPAEVMARFSTSNSAALTIGNGKTTELSVGDNTVFAYTLHGEQLPVFQMVQ